MLPTREFEHRLTRVEMISWVNLVLLAMLFGKDTILKLFGG